VTAENACQLRSASSRLVHGTSPIQSNATLCRGHRTCSPHTKHRRDGVEPSVRRQSARNAVRLRDTPCTIVSFAAPDGVVLVALHSCMRTGAFLVRSSRVRSLRWGPCPDGRPWGPHPPPHPADFATHRVPLVHSQNQTSSWRYLGTAFQNG